MSPFMEIPPVKQKFESKGIVTAVQHLNVTPKNQDYIYNILSYYKADILASIVFASIE